MFQPHRKSLSKIIACSLAVIFIVSSIVPPPAAAQAQVTTPLSQIFMPAIIKGMKIYSDNPLRFDFIVDKGSSNVTKKALQSESTKLIKYFLASLTVPEKDLWVNLSPHEKNRIIPEALGMTDMGRDLLAQDYILKQIASSLTFPESELGKKFWEKIYSELYKNCKDDPDASDRKSEGRDPDPRLCRGVGADIPTDVLNRIWIVPDKAVVYEDRDVAFVKEARLKVMLEDNNLSSAIKDVILPAIEKEVNEGENFAALRQIYNSLILATWFKRNLHKSILEKIYVGQNKIQGIDLKDKDAAREIYDQYLKAFKKGTYDYLKDDYDPATQQIVPRHYFSGGVSAYRVGEIFKSVNDSQKVRAIAQSVEDHAMVVKADLVPANVSSDDATTVSAEEDSRILTEVTRYLDKYPQLQDRDIPRAVTEIMDQFVFLPGNLRPDAADHMTTSISAFLENKTREMTTVRDKLLFQLADKIDELARIKAKPQPLEDVTTTTLEQYRATLTERIKRLVMRNEGNGARNISFRRAAKEIGIYYRILQRLLQGSHNHGMMTYLSIAKYSRAPLFSPLTEKIVKGQGCPYAFNNMAVNIRQARIRRGWSLTELARRAGITKHSVRRIEGGANPEIDMLWGISKALNIEIDQLLREIIYLDSDKEMISETEQWKYLPDVGDTLRLDAHVSAIRKRRGINQKQAGKDMGFALAYLSDIERSSSDNLRFKTVLKLANYFKVSFFELVTNKAPAGQEFIPYPEESVIKKNFGQNVRRMRLELRFTLKGLAALTQMEVHSIYRIERGVFVPGLRGIVALAKALKTPIDVLLGNQEGVKAYIKKMRREMREDAIFEAMGSQPIAAAVNDRQIAELLQVNHRTVANAFKVYPDIQALRKRPQKEDDRAMTAAKRLRVYVTSHPEDNLDDIAAALGMSRSVVWAKIQENGIPYTPKNKIAKSLLGDPGVTVQHDGGKILGAARTYLEIHPELKTKDIPEAVQQIMGGFIFVAGNLSEEGNPTKVAEFIRQKSNDKKSLEKSLLFKLAEAVDKKAQEKKAHQVTDFSPEKTMSPESYRVMIGVRIKRLRTMAEQLLLRSTDQAAVRIGISEKILKNLEEGMNNAPINTYLKVADYFKVYLFSELTNGVPRSESSPYDFKDIGFNVRRERERQGLTLSQLAEKSGIGTTVLYQIEHEKTFRVDTLFAIAKGLDRPMENVLRSVIYLDHALPEDHAMINSEAAERDAQRIVRVADEYLAHNGRLQTRKIPKAIQEIMRRLVLVPGNLGDDQNNLREVRTTVSEALRETVNGHNDARGQLLNFLADAIDQSAQKADLTKAANGKIFSAQKYRIKIGRRIKSLRLAKGKDEKAMAQEIGISKDTLMDIEQGLRSSQIRFYLTIIEYFQADIFAPLGQEVIAGENPEYHLANIGANLRRERERRRWGSGKLAQQAGLSKSAVQKIESGGDVKIDTVFKMSQAFNIPFDHLLKPIIYLDESIKEDKPFAVIYDQVPVPDTLNIPELVNRVNEWRRQKDWTTTQLAERSGLSRRQIKEFENQTVTRVTLKELARLANGFEVSVFYLLTGVKTEKETQADKFLLYPTDDDLQRVFTNNFKDFMTRPSLSYIRFAKDMSVKVQLTHAWMQGKQLPGVDMFLKVCQQLQATPDDLLRPHYDSIEKMQEPSIAADDAMVGNKKVGGIDLTPDQFNLETKGQDIDFALPANLKELETMPINGFRPAIIEMIPATNLPFLLGLDKTN